MARKTPYTPEIGRQEYQRRISAHPDVPRAVARGHGVVPARIAQAAEERRLTPEQSRRYADGLARYQLKHDREEIAKGRRRGQGVARPPHRLPGSYDTRAEAEASAQRLGISDDSVVVVSEGGAFYAFAA